MTKKTKIVYTAHQVHLDGESLSDLSAMFQAASLELGIPVKDLFLSVEYSYRDDENDSWYIGGTRPMTKDELDAEEKARFSAEQRRKESDAKLLEQLKARSPELFPPTFEEHPVL